MVLVIITDSINVPYNVYRKTSIDFGVMGTRGRKGDLKVKVESDERSEKTVTEKKIRKTIQELCEKNHQFK